MEAHDTAVETQVPVGEETVTKMRIRDWKGLLHSEPRRSRYSLFAMLFVVATSMTFAQFGFIGIGSNGDYICYAIGLLAPIAATALLLGKGAGALQGLLCGTVLYAHARIQPLDVIERYFVTILNSVVLFSYIGFFLGLLFAIALHTGRTGMLRRVYLAVVSLLASFATGIHFTVNLFLGLMYVYVMYSIKMSASEGQMSNQLMSALEALGNETYQVGLNFLLLFVTALIVDRFVRQFNESKKGVSVRIAFGTRLLVIVVMVFCVFSALFYSFVTVRTAARVSRDMSEDMSVIANEIVEGDKAMANAVGQADLDALSGREIDAIAKTSYIKTFISSYGLDKYGTVVVFNGNRVLCSNSPSYPKDATMEDVFGNIDEDFVTQLARSGEMREVLYDVRTPEQKKKDPIRFGGAEIGFAKAQVQGEYIVMIVKPFSLVYADRQTMMAGSTALSFLLLAVVFIVTAGMLGRDVITPIDRTNEKLSEITGGNLDVRVDERENVEFQSLSEGINDTVDALKGYIGEAEARMEAELDTAKTIQKSALPRVFPPFPEVDKFDIFASMDAAKSVGGDFYDYFLIDDHTLGFLIADVSGKGVPGALFMMASKTELENYMCAGMDLSQAIATANKRLCANNDAGMFVTVWAATLDYETGELIYVNAGHNYPLLRHGVGGEWEWLKQRSGFLVGVFDTAKYEQHTLTLEPGDELLLYTDGVNEAFNIDDVEYGNERLESFLAAHADMHSREVVRSLRADVARWAEGAEQSDDVTILALEYGVAPEVTGTITVPATLENLTAVTDFVNAELEARLCPVDVQHKVEIALEELFVNVCRYSYPDQDEPGTVKLRYAYGVNPSSITIELRDRGVPFDPIKREDPTKPSSVQEATIGGLGIFMVRKLMDDFTYMRHGDTNVVVIKKGW